MERPLKSDVVIVSYPFSDLSASKRRPALVLVSLPGKDVIISPMTSKERLDPYRLLITPDDFKKGGLATEGMLRTDNLFTADRRLIVRTAGTLHKEKMQRITETIIDMLRA